MDTRNNLNKHGETEKPYKYENKMEFNMKKYLALLLFLLITTISFGQSNYQDVIYLKNGSIIRGVIIEQIPNKSIKIETADRSVFVFQMDEIEKLTKEAIPSKWGGSISNSGLQPGYKGIVELGYNFGIDYKSMNRFKLNIINGYQINPYFSLGLGTGLRYHFSIEFNRGKMVIPFFADFRANFLNYKVSPYLSLGIGYSFDATDDFEGEGILLDPTVGVSFEISDNSSMNVGLGFEMQNYVNYETSKAIGVVVGISF